MTDEPAVLTWQIALAPRPRFTTNGRHWWRDMVTQAWRAAYDQWLLDLEAAEFRAENPPPLLRDFMRHLASGALAPEHALAGVALSDAA